MTQALTVPTRIENFANLHGIVVIDEKDNYKVQLPDCDYFVVMAGALYPTGATNFDHGNLAGYRDHVFETRAYWPSGRKKWFSHAGREYYFVIPRDKIFLKYERGYSYVPVQINGLDARFNTSGGTLGGGWTDWVRPSVHLSIDFTKKMLLKLAEVAIHPSQTTAELTEGFALERPEEFKRIVAGYVCRKKLAATHKIKMVGGDEYTVECKATRRQEYLVFDSTGYRWRLKFKDVDWEATATLNGFEFQQPVCVNRIAA